MQRLLLGKEGRTPRRAAQSYPCIYIKELPCQLVLGSSTTNTDLRNSILEQASHGLKYHECPCAGLFDAEQSCREPFRNHQKLLGMVHVGTSGVIMILCHQLMRSLRANVNTEFHLVTKTVLCKQSLVRALKLCLLKTLEGPREGFELLFTAVQQRPPLPTRPPPLSPQTVRVPSVPATLEFRSAGGVRKTAPCVIGDRSGQGESHFGLGLGTKCHATENSQSIVMRQRNHN